MFEYEKESEKLVIDSKTTINSVMTIINKHVGYDNISMIGEENFLSHIQNELQQKKLVL